MLFINGETLLRLKSIRKSLTSATPDCSGRPILLTIFCARNETKSDNSANFFMKTGIALICNDIG